MVWGFQGHAIDDPWADELDGVWHVPAGVGVPELLNHLDAAAAATARFLLHEGSTSKHPLAVDSTTTPIARLSPGRVFTYSRNTRVTSATSTSPSKC